MPLKGSMIGGGLSIERFDARSQHDIDLIQDAHDQLVAGNADGARKILAMILARPASKTAPLPRNLLTE